MTFELELDVPPNREVTSRRIFSSSRRTCSRISSGAGAPIGGAGGGAGGRTAAAERRQRQFTVR